MAKRPRPTAAFADIVRQVKEAPVPEEEPVPALCSPDGQPFYDTGRELAPADALELVAGDALVVLGLMRRRRRALRCAG
jgi:hypothetical protein